MTHEPRDAHSDQSLSDAQDEQALNDALNDLEKILGKQSGRNASAPGLDTADLDGIDLSDTSGDDWASDSTIAGLDDLAHAGPGRPLTARPEHEDETLANLMGNDEAGAAPADTGPAGTGHEASRLAGDDDGIWGDALTDRVARRLASEIEVITQACLEDSLERVAAQVRERVHAHIAIVLPEILEEMARGDFDAPDDYSDTDDENSGNHRVD